ncbi:MAG: preprotein translocase subunit SecE [Planctomycetota bacterium]
MADEANDSKSPASSAAAPAVEHRGMSVYKPGQGYYTRMGTVIGIAVITLLAIDWLWQPMKGIRVGTLPEIYVATAGAILIGGIVTYLAYTLVFVKPKTVDFLVATEGEMKKVNWSTKREVIGSTNAVILSAVVIAVFCYVIDIAFFAFFAQIKVIDVGP